MTDTYSEHSEKILEAIDQLRKRKARPDFQRICNYLFRHFFLTSVVAKDSLEWCVSKGIVLKVEYKGSISYRNAAKKLAQVRHRDTKMSAYHMVPAHKLQAASKDFMELLTNVFGEMVVDEPDYLEDGIPPLELVENVLMKDSVRYTRNYIGMLLMKEVKQGNLHKLSNGNLLLALYADSKDTKEKANFSIENQGIVESPTIEHNIELDPLLSLPSGTMFYREIKEEEDDKPISNSYQQIDKHFPSVKNPTSIASGMISKKSEAFSNDKLSFSLSSTKEKPNEMKTEVGVRLGARRKKVKKVFDPSDTHVPRKRGRPLGSLNRTTLERIDKYSLEKNIKKEPDDSNSKSDSRCSMGAGNSSSREQGGVCSVCHTQNKKGPNDRMVACRECSNKAHYSCLNGDDMMLKMYPDNSWQCPHCKICVVCYETANAGNLVVCSICADGYHPSCHQPRIMEKIRNGQRWLCTNCQKSEDMKINDIQSNIGDTISHKIKTEYNDKETTNTSSSSDDSVSSSPTPPHLSPQTVKVKTELNDSDSNSQNSKESEEDPDIDPSIPDASLWTPDEVYRYFVQFFPREAKVFKEQEIDGRSLLLLTRQDVLIHLKLKLGPALKIYRRITMLQLRRDDPNAYLL